MKMSEIFNDTNSSIIFFVGVIVSSIFLIGVWEFTRQSVTGLEGTISAKIKKKDVNKA
tara:strand:+ start:70 stop:243 length:174 start_codon:yes stop_codon:yes gene_type:complete